MINISRVSKCGKQSRDHFQNATKVVRFYGSRAQSVRDINTLLTRVWTPDLWPVLKTGANTNKHNTKPHSHQLKRHCMPKPLKPTQIITLRRSSLFVAPWDATKSVIQTTHTSLRLSGYNQGKSSIIQRAHCETELRICIHPLTEMTQPVMIFISVTC